MRLGQLSFKAKITGGFACILLLFVVGLGIGILGTNKISVMMELSNKSNRLVKEMLQAREQEKEYLIHGMAASVENVSERTASAAALLSEIESQTDDTVLLGDLGEASDLVAGYYESFKEVVANTDRIRKLQSDMRAASNLLFETI